MLEIRKQYLEVTTILEKGKNEELKKVSDTTTNNIRIIFNNYLNKKFTIFLEKRIVNILWHDSLNKLASFRRSIIK